MMMFGDQRVDGQVHRPVGLEDRRLPGIGKSLQKLRGILLMEGLPSGEADAPDISDDVHQFVHGQVHRGIAVAEGIPRVAPGTSQIASGPSDEICQTAHLQTFSLYRQEMLDDLHCTTPSS